MEQGRKLRALRISLSQDGRTKGDEVVFFCPRHGAKSGRRDGQLSVNLKTDWFHCWSCGFGGKNLIPLLILRGKTEVLEEYRKELQSKRPEAKPERVYQVPTLPAEFKSLLRPTDSPWYSRAMAYLSRRGVTAEDILRWKLGYCEDGDYRQRIIVPSFNRDGELNFFVGRLFMGEGMRYKHGDFNKDIVFNEYLIDWERSVVLTEGPFDAIKAGDNAIPLQGNAVRVESQLFEMIVASGVMVYFALDTDAFRKQLTIIKTFLEYGVGSYYIDLGPFKDVGEMTHQEFQERKARAMPVRDSLDLIRMRVNQ